MPSLSLDWDFRGKCSGLPLPKSCLGITLEPGFFSLRTRVLKYVISVFISRPAPGERQKYAAAYATRNQRIKWSWRDRSGRFENCSKSGLQSVLFLFFFRRFSDHLKIHMKTHDNQKPFQCTVCNRGYSTAAALTSHMQNHHKRAAERSNSPQISGPSYKCLQCTQIFRKPDELQVGRARGVALFIFVFIFFFYGIGNC